MEEILSIQWDNYPSTLLNSLQNHRLNNSFCDVTISCRGSFFPVHKIILSSFSGYFKEVLERTPCSHPFIIMQDISIEELQLLLDFLYIGKIGIPSNQFSSLLNTSKLFKIEGLTKCLESFLNSQNVNSYEENSLQALNKINSNEKNSKASNCHPKQFVNENKRDNLDCEIKFINVKRSKLANDALSSNIHEYSNECEFYDKYNRIKPNVWPMDLQRNSLIETIIKKERLEDDCNENSVISNNKHCHTESLSILSDVDLGKPFESLESNDTPVNACNSGKESTDPLNSIGNETEMGFNFSSSGRKCGNNLGGLMQGEILPRFEPQEEALGTGLELLIRECHSIRDFESISDEDESANEKDASELDPCGKGNFREVNVSGSTLRERKLFICDACPYKTKLKSQLISHMKIHSAEKPYKCKLGGSSPDLKKPKNNLKKLKCEHCSFQSFDGKRFLHHKSLHSRKIFLFCNHCPFQTTNRKVLADHLESHKTESNTNAFECKKCSFKSESKEDLYFHFKTHSEYKFRCRNCCYVAIKKTDLKDHLDKVHNMRRPLECSMCTQRFTIYSLLLNHYRTFHNKKDVLFLCKLCSFKTESKSLYFSHSIDFCKNRTDKIIRIYKCSGCSFQTKSNTVLKLHSNVHSSEGRLKCGYCSQIFNSQDSFESHLREHLTFEKVLRSNFRIYQCRQCSYVTTQKSSLETHSNCHLCDDMNVKDGKVYKCEHCSYETKLNEDLIYHSNTHIDGKVVQGANSSYYTRRKAAFLRRTQVRNGPENSKDSGGKKKDRGERVSQSKKSKRPLKKINSRESILNCNFCSYKTTHKYHFKVHMLMHTSGIQAPEDGNKKFSCDQCGFRSNAKSSFEYHMRIHSGEKPYSCNLCEYRARNVTNLNLHRKSHKNKTGAEQNSSSRNQNSNGGSGSLIVYEGGGSTEAARIDKNALKMEPEKKYYCDQCDFKSDRKCLMLCHNWVHSGRKHSCKFCTNDSKDASSVQEQNGEEEEEEEGGSQEVYVIGSQGESKLTDSFEPNLKTGDEFEENLNQSGKLHQDTAPEVSAEHSNDPKGNEGFENYMDILFSAWEDEMMKVDGVFKDNINSTF